MSTKKKTHESSRVHRASTNQTLSNQTRRRDCKPTRGNNTLRLPRGRNGTAEKPPLHSRGRVPCELSTSGARPPP